ncbi:uncharacterized protein ARMOST_10499 [Armillaria ostoyae]|uniref:Uncharacterized protein n=1 Tax=Armillaria ostoyae TaxID=47428 RepID=A0A284REI2_ARMOS|nr:uncharacterized protein ARMOST_10499 [Armillaria ostoyae]
MAETPHPSASTTTLQSTTTVTSTSPLNPPPGPKKDYAAAFGSLQSRYGTGGFVPNPKPTRSKRASTVPAIPEGIAAASSSTPDRGVDSGGVQSDQAGHMFVGRDSLKFIYHQENRKGRLVQFL